MEVLVLQGTLIHTYQKIHMGIVQKAMVLLLVPFC